MTHNKRAYLALVCRCGSHDVPLSQGRCTSCGQLITTPAQWHCHCNRATTVKPRGDILACIACGDTYNVEDPEGYAYNV